MTDTPQSEQAGTSSPRGTRKDRQLTVGEWVMNTDCRMCKQSNKLIKQLKPFHKQALKDANLPEKDSLSGDERKQDYEKILDEFIQTERERTQMGSGDDLLYELQVEDYINKQRAFWIGFMKFFEEKVLKLADTHHKKVVEGMKQRFKDYIHKDKCEFLVKFQKAAKNKEISQLKDDYSRLDELKKKYVRLLNKRNKEIDRLEAENNDIKIAFGYLNKNKKHLWNKVHTQKRLREDMRERERSKFRKELDDKWEKIRKEHDRFCKCGMKGHCELYGITSMKEVFDELKDGLEESAP